MSGRELRRLAGRLPMQGFSSAPGTAGPLTEIPAAGRRRIWLWASLIAVGGFLFGFDTGVISGALLFIESDFALNAFEQGSVVSILVLGAMVGALRSGRLADRIGRRKILGLEGTVFLLGTIGAVLAPGYWLLLVSRLILGLAVGAASATVPIYISEIAPKENRGRMLTLNQLMITVGILIAYLINLAFADGGNWRAMIGVGAIPAVVMIVSALWVLPESVEWLIAQGRIDEAKRLIASVTNEATADLLILRRTEHRQQAATQATSTRQGWSVLFGPRVKPALTVGLTLAAIQQFGGINTIIYYAPTIIEQTGLTASNAIFYSIAIGIINLAMTIVTIRLIDRSGRRKLLLFSLGGMTVTLVLLGLSFVAGWSSVLSLVFMVLYIATFAVGLGPVFWALIGEIFPSEAHAAGSGVSTSVNWAANFLVSLVFLSIVNAIGQGQTFWLFAIVSALGVVFVALYVPETKERDAETIEADLHNRFGRTAPGNSEI